eukprot:m.484120 g.484120  ORF g.484120 m.484120 type:complete len:307 (-) comp23218_c0_seq1:162-1082(-)
MAAATGCTRAVLVSGGNRGLGFATCRLLLQHDTNTHVILGSRSPEAGEGAVHKLAEACGAAAAARVTVLPLDVTSNESVVAATDSVSELLGGLGLPSLTVLVNNAGVALDLPWASQPWDPSFARKTLDINYHAATNLYKHMEKLLDPASSRVVNVSSLMATMNTENCDPALRQKLIDSKTEGDIDALCAAFINDYEQAAAAAIRSGDAADALPKLSPGGFWLESYGFSKACLNAWTQQMAHHRASKTPLIVNCTPGFILTDMTSAAGTKPTKTPEQGASVIHWLTFADNLEHGAFYGENRLVIPPL